ncbi:MAG: patatin-like phospholipase family protein, partial [Bacteroidales bacterium]
HKLIDFVQVRIPKTGLMNLDKLRIHLSEDIKADNLEDLEIPFYVTVSDIINGKVEYINEGPLVKLVQASASIPVLFSPVEIDGKMYSDGGLLDNVPVEPLQDICRKIIAVNISPIQKTDRVKNMIQIAARTFHLSVNSTINGLEERCDLIIEPKELSEFDILDASRAEEAYRVGYDYCRKMDIRL